MLIQSMLKYLCISICLLFCSVDLLALPTNDTVDIAKPKEQYGHQICVGVDIFQPFISSTVNYRTGYEFTADYYFKNDVYFVVEAGWGDANINYPDLVYKSTNNFFRIGINKSLFARLSPKDWDMGFVGLRYGFASIQRSNATYTVIDSFWGNTTGSVPAQELNCHWVELSGGMRVELFKGICAGYTIRGKFRLNNNDFQLLAPVYIAGYGRGDKNSVFDFNLYISYAIRWKRKGDSPH